MTVRLRPLGAAMTAVAIGAVIGAFALAGLAYAHVEVAADPAVMGATDAVVTFTAEAESTSAGVASVQVFLPDGLTSNDISLNKAPAGWQLTGDGGSYTVAGPALPTGQEAVHSVIVTHLPTMAALVFKTLVTYGDRTVDRWIEEKSATNPNPDHPAPVLALAQPGGAGASSAATGSPAPSATGAPAAAARSTGRTSWWLVGAVIVAVAAVAAALILRHRRRPESAPTQSTSGEAK